MPLSILLMTRVLFIFLLKLNSQYSYTCTSLLQQTLKQNHCYSVKNMLKFLPFKRLLNELLLETNWFEVMLIWLFVSINFIRSFFKILFFDIFIQTIPLVISTLPETLSLFQLQISLWLSNFIFPPVFLLRKVSSSFFHLPFLSLRVEGEETLKYHCICWPLYGKV